MILKAAGDHVDRVLQARDAQGRPRVVRNEALMKALYRLPLDAAIGPELYRVIAVLLAHVFAMDAQFEKERESAND